MSLLINSNRVISVLLLIVSAYVWFTASGFPERTGAGPGPDFFPKMAAIILAFLALLLFFQKVVRDEENEVDNLPFSKEDIKRFVVVFLALFILVLVVPYIGFFVGATIFIIAWMYLMKEKNWKFMLILSVVFSLGITLVFEYLLGVQIPHGILY